MIYSDRLFSAGEHCRETHSALSPRYLRVTSNILERAYFPKFPIKWVLVSLFILAEFMGILWHLRLL